MTEESTKGRIPRTSSALRLRNLLSELKTTGATSLFTLLPHQLGIVPQDGVSPDPNLLAIKGFSNFAKMIDDVIREINEARMDSEDQIFYLQWIPGVCSALSPTTVSQPWSDIRGRITDVDISRLDHLDRILMSKVTENKLTIDDFVDLLNAVETALGALLASDLPREVQDFIAIQLLNVKSAVDQYKYRGVWPVREALITYRGSVALSAEALDEKATPGEKQNLNDVLETGTKLLTLAHGFAWVWPHVEELGTAVLKFLGS